jgi:hypothetical protein
MKILEKLYNIPKHNTIYYKGLILYIDYKETILGIEYCVCTILNKPKIATIRLNIRESAEILSGDLV